MNFDDGEVGCTAKLRGLGVREDDLSAWFVEQVLPLEGVLERYLRRNWRDAGEIADLRQEVYARVYDGCAQRRPESAQAFVLSTARNLLIDRARRAQIVSIEAFADMDTLAPTIDELSPERHLAARSELRLLRWQWQRWQVRLHSRLWL
eukprot:gene34585-42662_t